MIGLLIGFKRYKWGGKMQNFLMIIVVELMSFLKKEKVITKKKYKDLP